MNTPARGKVLEQFYNGKVLQLFPHYDLADPHGTNLYNKPDVKDDRGRDYKSFIREHPTNFNPSSCDLAGIVEVQILKAVRAGVDNGTQSFLANVTMPPRTPDRADRARLVSGEVLVKVFHSAFFAIESDNSFYNVRGDELADSYFTREAGALQYLHKQQLSGPAKIVPEYYGTWALRDRFAVGSKYVGVILMEFIRGHSMEDLSDRNGPSGSLAAREGFQPMPYLEQDRYGLHMTDGIFLRLTEKVRLRILKQIFFEYVHHLKAGVRRDEISLRDIIITKTQGYIVLDRPRPVLIHHVLSQVWSKTRLAQKSPSAKHRFEKFAKPIHPADFFDQEAIGELAAWVPEDWKGENAYKFTGWLMLEFGTFDTPEEDRRFSVFDDEPSTFARWDKDELEERKTFLAKARDYCTQLAERKRPPGPVRSLKRQASSEPIEGEPASSRARLQGPIAAEPDLTGFSDQPSAASAPKISTDDCGDLVYGGRPEERPLGE